MGQKKRKMEKEIKTVTEGGDGRMLMVEAHSICTGAPLICTGELDRFNNPYN
jgi:hypothetical protein